MRHPPPGDATPGGRSKVQRIGVREVDGRRIRGVRLPYRPGLDGLRALAVIAVLLYHAGLAWIPGGFLGVEVFFVISGYLITALLLAEWRGRGRVALKAFWLRRARRLLPALYLLLVVTLAYAVVFLPGEVAGLRGDALAAFGYVTNWYLVFGQESYFEAVGRPSLLKHLWSLAVEEQFYLLWPLVFAVGMGVGATRLRRRRVVTVALAGAVASAMVMAVLYVPGVDPSRIYYGTDTRATGLLFGAALAFVWSQGGKYRPADTRHQRLGLPRRGRFRRRWGWVVPTLLDLLGLAALGGLVWFCLRLGEVVVVHLGNNGTFTEEQFDDVMQTLSGVDRVVFVNVKVPRAWERPNNQVISEGVQRYPNAVLVDWYSASASRPELFYGDGFHLRPVGQRAYTDLISANLAAP